MESMEDGLLQVSVESEEPLDEEVLDDEEAGMLNCVLRWCKMNEPVIEFMISIMQYCERGFIGCGSCTVHASIHVHVLKVNICQW